MFELRKEVEEFSSAETALVGTELAPPKQSIQEPEKEVEVKPAEPVNSEVATPIILNAPASFGDSTSSTTRTLGWSQYSLGSSVTSFGSSFCTPAPGVVKPAPPVPSGKLWHTPLESLHSPFNSPFVTPAMGLAKPTPPSPTLDGPIPSTSFTPPGLPIGKGAPTRPSTPAQLSKATTTPSATKGNGAPTIASKQGPGQKREKKGACKHALNGTECPYGDECWYEHNLKSIVCKYYDPKDSKACPDRERCPYKCWKDHALDRLPSPNLDSSDDDYDTQSDGWDFDFASPPAPSSPKPAAEHPDALRKAKNKAKTPCRHGRSCGIRGCEFAHDTKGIECKFYKNKEGQLWPCQYKQGCKFKCYKEHRDELDQPGSIPLEILYSQYHEGAGEYFDWEPVLDGREPRKGAKEKLAAYRARNGG